MLNAAEHREHMACFERIRTALVDAQAERRSRPELVDTPDGREVGWIVFERETVWRAVNDERARLGHRPVPLAEIVRVETSASGHIDYTYKFALHAAELVLDTTGDPS